MLAALGVVSKVLLVVPQLRRSVSARLLGTDGPFLPLLEGHVQLGLQFPRSVHASPSRDLHILSHQVLKERHARPGYARWGQDVLQALQNIWSQVELQIALVSFALMPATEQWV